MANFGIALMLTLRVLVNTMIASTTRHTPNLRPWAETSICVANLGGLKPMHDFGMLMNPDFR